MKKVFFLLCIALTLALPGSSHAGESVHTPKVALSPKKVGPGDLLLITVKNTNVPVEGTFDSKKIYFNSSQNGYKAVVGIDLLSEPGKYKLEITTNGTTHVMRIVTVSKKKYPVQQLTLPKGMVELSPENEARAEREQKKVASIWPNRVGPDLGGQFYRTRREGEIVTTFGVKQVHEQYPEEPPHRC